MGGAGPGDARGDLGRLAWVPNGRCEKGGPFSPPDLPIYLAGTLGSCHGGSLVQSPETLCCELTFSHSAWHLQDGGFSSQLIAPGRGNQELGLHFPAIRSSIFQKAESQES